MTLVRSRPGRLIPLLLVLLASMFGRAIAGQSGVSHRPSPSRPAGVTWAPQNGPSSVGATSELKQSGLDLASIDQARHRQQIVRVVDSMDRNGVPPAGVAQGGRRGGTKGLFLNAEGRLPRKAAGYWIEADVWPTRGSRDAERLIFGRKREVYWTRDHYETFLRLR